MQRSRRGDKNLDLKIGDQRGAPTFDPLLQRAIEWFNLTAPLGTAVLKHFNSHSENNLRDYLPLNFELTV